MAVKKKLKGGDGMRRLAIFTSLIIMIMMMMTIGCASYYRITDPATGKDYYTEKFERKGGGVIFKDINTSETVTLPSSEVLEISKDQYKAKTVTK